MIFISGMGRKRMLGFGLDNGRPEVGRYRPQLQPTHFVHLNAEGGAMELRLGVSFFTLCALIVSLVVHGHQPSNLEPTPAPVEESTPTMIQISPTVIPEVIPTETPQITASPTNVVKSATPGHTNLIMNCIEVTAETPALYRSSGYLVLWGLEQARPVVIDMQTGSKSPCRMVGILPVGVSS